MRNRGRRLGPPGVEPHERERNADPHDDIRCQDRQGCSDSEPRYGLDVGRRVGEERDPISDHGQRQGGQHPGHPYPEGPPGVRERPPLLAVAVDGVDSEVRPQGDHCNGHDEVEDRGGVESDQVGEPLEPHYHERQTDRGQQDDSGGAEADAYHNQDHEEGRHDEGNGGRDLVRYLESGVDGHAPEPVALLVSSKDGLNVAIEVLLALGDGVAGGADSEAAAAELPVVGSNAEEDRGRGPVVDLPAQDGLSLYLPLLGHEFLEGLVPRVLQDEMDRELDLFVAGP